MNVTCLVAGAGAELWHTVPVCVWAAATALVTAPGETRHARRLAAGTWRDGRGYLPRWLAWTLGLCLAIPGPVDELAACVPVVIVMAVDARARRGIVAALYGANVYTQEV